MGVQMTVQRREAYTELLEVLKRVDTSLINKIPQELLNYFKQYKSEEYKYIYDDNLSLSEQKLNSITLSLLAMLNLNYWCEDEEHKKELLRNYNENEIKYQEELREKYNPDNIFKDRQVSSTPVAENMQMVEYKKPTWYKKIFEKILSIFKRN